MKPLVLHAAAFANPAGGGFIDALEHLAANDTFATALVCPKRSAGFAWTRRLAQAGVRVLYAGTPFEVARTVAQSAPDVVHAHFVDWMLPATLGAAAARARVAWHLHSGATQSRGARDLARRLKYASAKRLVDRFFCVSPDLVEYLVGYGVPPARIAELPNGVDLEHFHPPDLRERTAARRALGLWPRDRVVIFFGRDAHIKGADRLAAALEHIEDTPRILLVAPSTETKRALFGYDVIDAGMLADVRDAYWAGDALALPSRKEGVPYALLEARACGLPCVAHDLPGLRRISTGDPGSVLLDAGVDAALARGLERALALGTIPLSGELAKTLSLERWTQALAAWYVDDLAV